MAKSIKELIMEGKKARVAAGVTGGVLGAGGTIAGVGGKAVEQEADEAIARVRKSLGGQILEKGFGVDPLETTDEGRRLKAMKYGAKAIKELGYAGAGAGAALLGGAIVASLLANKDKRAALRAAASKFFNRNKAK